RPLAARAARSSPMANRTGRSPTSGSAGSVTIDIPALEPTGGCSGGLVADGCFDVAHAPSKPLAAQPAARLACWRKRLRLMRLEESEGFIASAPSVGTERQRTQWSDE